MEMDAAETTTLSFECTVCLDVPRAAVETDCCGQIFCQMCLDQLKSKTCPQCRYREFTYHRSLFVQRQIENRIMDCPQKCGVKVSPGALKVHLRKCEKKEYQCPSRNCNSKIPRSEYIGHLAEEHVDELEAVMKRLFAEFEAEETEDCADELLPFTSDPKFDPSITGIRNDTGRVARLGENGKYYCGVAMKCPLKEKPPHGYKCPCICCKYSAEICGPRTGCNCESCMRLDIKSRGLFKDWLVNSNGASTKHTPAEDGTLGTFSCGRRSLEKEENCKKTSLEPYCGTTPGQSCSECSVLRLHVVEGVYKVILDIE